MGEATSIGYPAGDTLRGFGYTERCQPVTRSCSRLVSAAVEAIVADLGRATNRPFSLPDAYKGDRLLVDFERDPPVHWRSADGQRGSASQLWFDLTGQVEGDGPGLAVLQAGTQSVTYELSPQQGQRLLDVLFTRLH